MTLDEAVVFLKGYLDSETYTNRCNEAHQIAVESVEKQIPKKPYYRKEEDAKGFACPECDMGVTVDHGRIKEDYCSSCGQKIDWSEE